MHPKELQPGIVLKRSPFLVVRRLENKELRVYSRLHGNLTSFDFGIDKILTMFDSRIDVDTVARKASQVYRLEPMGLIKELYEKRFLVEENKSEKELFFEYVEMVREKNRTPSVSKATFLISGKCNLACRGCYHNFFDFKSTDMSIDTARQILEGLFPYLKKRGIPSVVISFLGYEPLLNFETLTAIYDQAHRMGNDYGITTQFRIFTNAFSVSNEIHEWIRLHRSNLEVMVSLDGIREDNDKRRVDLTGGGSYCGVTENLKRIIASGVECGVLTVLSRYNFDNIEKFVDEMAVIGIKTITGNIFCGQSEDELLVELNESEKFEAIKRMDLATEKYGIEFDGEWKFAVVQMITGAHFYCPAGIKQLVFSADGVIYPCQRFAGTQLNFGTYTPDFWESLIVGQCESYNKWAAALYDGVTERIREHDADLTGWSCPFLPFLRGQCISKNLEKELNMYLIEHFLTRPLNRIHGKAPLTCSSH